MSELSDFKQKCDKIIRLFTEDLLSIKTGRAKPSLLEHIKVQVYGDSWMEIRELASVSATDAHSLVVSPWDKSILKDLEKGLASSEAGVNPIIDGEVIRINIPVLTEERRREFVKLVHQKGESHKAMIRSERINTKKNIETTKNTNGVSEDDVHKDLEELQKSTDEAMSKIDEISKEKENELMTV